MKKFIKTFVACGLVLLSYCFTAYCAPVTENREQVPIGANENGETVYSINYVGKVRSDFKVKDIVDQFNKNVLNRIQYDETTAQKLMQDFKNKGKTLGEFKEEVLLRLDMASDENKMRGTCFMFSIIMEDILSSNGLENYIMHVGKDHVANLYKIGGQWLIADVTRAMEIALKDDGIVEYIVPYAHTALDIPPACYTDFMKHAFGKNIVNDWIRDNCSDKILDVFPPLQLGVSTDLNNRNLSSQSVGLPFDAFLKFR